jgi:general secretion pathway protein D
MVKKIICILLLFSFFLSAAGISSDAFGSDSKNEKVAINFVDVDLPVIARFFSEITKKNFIFDERVKGKITIVAPSKINVDDAFNLFTSVLSLKGFTFVPTAADAYKIIPTTEAKQRGIDVSDESRPVNENYIARLVPLKDISAGEVLKFIRPMVSKDGYTSVFGPGNMLLVIDSGTNIEKIGYIIEAIDRPSTDEMPAIVYLKHASADVIAKALNEGMSQRQQSASPASSQTLPGGTVKAIADQRLNAVILFGDKISKGLMQSLVSLLDVRPPETQGMINVYFLENADATELSKVLESLVKVKPVQPQAAMAPPVTAFETAGGITITADKASNALVIVASPADYRNLYQIIKQLDKRRRQVFVEAMIAEVSIDKLLDLGTKWRAAVNDGGEPVLVGGIGTVDASTISSILTGMTGLAIGGLANYFTIPQSFIPGATSDLSIPRISALFSLSDFKGAVNVLSTPQILTSDNKEAEILVGENIPMISKRERDITTTSTVLTSIERKDVGVMLKLTPQINEGEYVKLDIYQEISAQKQESENVITSVGPTMTKRSTKTSVVVKDKQSVVIGGLMSERDEESVTKVPVLGEIPILGWLFKYKTTNKTKTNLLIFLTPYIIKDSSYLSRLSRDKLNNYVMNEKQFVADEMLVTFREGVPVETVREIITGKKALVLKNVEERVYHIKFDKGQEFQDAVNSFSGVPEVENVEPVPRIKISE